jgi:hypothetical protein
LLLLWILYLATHYKIVFNWFRIIYASPTCFGASYAIIRGFVVENQVLLCIGSFVFGLTVVVDSVLFFLLRSWLVYDDVLYVCSIVLLCEWFILCFIYMLLSLLLWFRSSLLCSTPAVVVCETCSCGCCCYIDIAFSCIIVDIL